MADNSIVGVLNAGNNANFTYSITTESDDNPFTLDADGTVKYNQANGVLVAGDEHWFRAIVINTENGNADTATVNIDISGPLEFTKEHYYVDVDVSDGAIRIGRNEIDEEFDIKYPTGIDNLTASFDVLGNSYFERKFNIAASADQSSVQLTNTRRFLGTRTRELNGATFEIKVTGSDGSSDTAKVTFRVAGLPAPPVVPVITAPTSSNNINNLSEVIDLARLAQHVYSSTNEINTIWVPGWEQVGNAFRDPGNMTSGFKAALYYNETQDRYVLAYAGTENEDFREFPLVDWITNFKQGLGIETSQYEYAAKLAKRMQDKYGSKLSFVGHSLGGGLATLAAAVTDLEATTFNPAGVHDATFKKWNTSRGTANRYVTAYRLQYEPLTTLQDSDFTPIDYPLSWPFIPFSGLATPLFFLNWGELMPNAVGAMPVRVKSPLSFQRSRVTICHSFGTVAEMRIARQRLLFCPL